jgi:hypothetical protein
MANGTRPTMSKEDLLRTAGFRWHSMRTIWISTDARKAFSGEVVEDRDEAWLQSRLRMSVSHGGVWVFFSAPPNNPSVCREILDECGLPSLSPVLQS